MCVRTEDRYVCLLAVNLVKVNNSQVWRITIILSYKIELFNMLQRNMLYLVVKTELLLKKQVEL